MLLGAVIASELFGTTALKLSEGFTRPLPSVGVVVFGEEVDLAGAVGILLVLAGIVCLDVVSAMPAH